MTMRFQTYKLMTQTGTNGTLQFLFEFLDFMRSASPTGPGWTIPKSSDGVTVNTDQDNIGAWGDLTFYVAGTSVSWFVLQDPAGGRELLWWRADYNDDNWYWYYSPSAGFTGGDKGNRPTAADQVGLQSLDDMHSAATVPTVLHAGADDAAPFGFWVWAHNAGNFDTTASSMAMFPITHPAPLDSDSVVFYSGMDEAAFGNALYYSPASPAWNAAKCSARKPGVGTGFYLCAALRMMSEGTQTPFAPNECAPDYNGDDLGFPMLFARQALVGNGFYKGITTWAQWNGVLRSRGETFAGKTRISVGNISVPWDGSTTPLSS